MENGNGVDSCDKAEVNLDKKPETAAAVVIMALEDEKLPPSGLATDDGVSEDKLKTTARTNLTPGLFIFPPS